MDFFINPKRRILRTWPQKFKYWVQWPFIRFGLWLGFHPCSQDDYLDMVTAYATRYKLTLAADDLHRQAIEWAATRGARSGRVAWQFIQDLAGKMGKRVF